jgi:hypothetical protein
MSVLKLSEIDFEKLQLGKSGRTAKLIYEKESFQMHTIKLYTPFGVKSVNKEWSPMTEYYIDCSLNQSDSELTVEFRNQVESLDETIKKLVFDNTELFRGQTTDSAVYNPILRENGTYPKLIRLQLPRDKNGNFTFFAFDEKKEKIKITEANIENVLSRGSVFRGIIECQKVWLYNGKIGSIWNLVQLKMCKEFIKPKEAAVPIMECIIDDE